MVRGLNLYYADPAQPLTTARERPNALDHDLFEVWSSVLGTYQVVRIGADTDEVSCTSRGNSV